MCLGLLLGSFLAVAKFGFAFLHTFAKCCKVQQAATVITTSTGIVALTVVGWHCSLPLPSVVKLQLEIHQLNDEKVDVPNAHKVQGTQSIKKTHLAHACHGYAKLKEWNQTM